MGKKKSESFTSIQEMTQQDSSQYQEEDMPHRVIPSFGGRLAVEAVLGLTISGLEMVLV